MEGHLLAPVRHRPPLGLPRLVCRPQGRHARRAPGQGFITPSKGVLGIVGGPVTLFKGLDENAARCDGDQANYPRHPEQTDREKKNGLQAHDSSFSRAANAAIEHKRDAPVNLQVHAVVQLKAEAARGRGAYFGIMVSITNPQLTITTDRAQNKAMVVVECELEFTQFEVNAMTRLGLRYLLRCELLNMEMLYPESVAAFVWQEFPHSPGEVRAREHAAFETVSPMRDLHLYIFGKDLLVAQLTLRNEETGVQELTRTPVVMVDLAA
jgi:hypothetical protein